MAACGPAAEPLTIWPDAGGGAPADEQSLASRGWHTAAVGQIQAKIGDYKARKNLRRHGVWPAKAETFTLRPRTENCHSDPADTPFAEEENGGHKARGRAGLHRCAFSHHRRTQRRERRNCLLSRSRRPAPNIQASAGRLPLRVPRAARSGPLPYRRGSASRPGRSLVCRHATPVSASVFTGHSPCRSLCVRLFLVQMTPVGSGPTQPLCPHLRCCICTGPLANKVTRLVSSGQA